MFEALSKKIGFTGTEIKVILLLIASFVLGICLKFIFQVKQDGTAEVFNYSHQDSLFNIYSGMNQPNSESENSSESLNEIKKEVLGISGEKNWQSTKKVLPEVNSINLNSATIDELTTLPGIGIKTAEKIIEQRQNMSGFKKLEDLLEVKGIGEVKFNNIKKFLYIK